MNEQNVCQNLYKILHVKHLPSLMAHILFVVSPTITTIDKVTKKKNDPIKVAWLSRETQINIAEIQPDHVHRTIESHAHEIAAVSVIVLNFLPEHVDLFAIILRKISNPMASLKAL